MIFSKNTRVVARYENKTLLRSWFFRIFAGLVLFVIFSMNMGIFSPAGNGDWEFWALSSSIPYLNLFFLNLGQAIICVFLASDFLKRDKKLDTTEVLYVRPVSNMEYVWGKTLGIIRLFLGLNLLVLLIGLIFNIVSQEIDIQPITYIYYLLVLSLPTLVYILGLSFFLMSVVKNQAVTFVLLLGYIGASLIYLSSDANFFFDYLAFKLPLLYSDITGFSETGYLLYQRIMYLMLGLGFIMASVLLLKRLPQSRISRSLAWISMIAAFIIAGYTGWHQLNRYQQQKKDWNLLMEINREYENKPFMDMDSCFIQVIPGRELSATAQLHLTNNTSIETRQLLLSLNPGLEVSSILFGKQEAAWERKHHLLIIPVEKSIAPGESVKVEVVYQGRLSEQYAYPEKLYQEEEELYGIEMMNIARKYAFQQSDYMLYTPETHWYPVAALNYYPGNPVRVKEDFTRYSLQVNEPEGLRAVSQGKRNENKDGTVLFTPGDPLTSVSLIVGPYEEKMLTVDSVDYKLYHFRGHDYFSESFTEIRDTLPNLIRTIKTEFEAELNREYPFNELSLVEVPIQFFSHLRKHTLRQAEVQPTLILLPEKGTNLPDAGFSQIMAQEKRNMERRNQVLTDKELEVRVFYRFIRRNFTGGVNFDFRRGRQTLTRSKYLVTPNYYYFCNQIDDPEIPIINTINELKFYPVDQRSQRMQMFTGGLGEAEIANLLLRRYSFEEYLATNPGKDSLNAVMKAKSDFFFSLLQAGPGIEEADDFLISFLDEHKFSKISLDQFTQAYSEKYGLDIKEDIRYWYTSSDLAGIRLDHLEAHEIMVDNRTRYQVNLSLSNPAEGLGLVRIGFRLSGGGGPGSRGGGGGARMMGGGMMGGGGFSMDYEDVYRLDPQQSVEVGIVLDGPPRMMNVNTMVSLNLPSQMMEMFGTLEANRSLVAFEGEEVSNNIPPLIPEGVIVVDNEDRGFSYYESSNVNRLRKWLGQAENEDQDNYASIRSYWPPQYWQPVIGDDYYGEFVHSAVYTRAGAGDRLLTWHTNIEEKGYYEVEAYLNRSPQDRRRGFRNRDNEGGQEKVEYNFKIYHDDGVEELTIDLADIEEGWVNLGNYYLSPGQTKVELSNTSTSNLVIGDAIKWIKQK